jgi:hypothetical protein
VAASGSRLVEKATTIRGVAGDHAVTPQSWALSSSSPSSGSVSSRS